MADQQIKNLNYLVVPTKLTRAAKEQNDVYEFWIQHWTKAFKETGSPEEGWESHFIKADLVTALRDGNAVLTCHLYSFYDLRSKATLASEYFSYLQPSSVQKMRDLNLNSLMSLEYLGVDPAYHHNSAGVSLGKLTVELGARLGEALGLDAVFGTPISTTKTDKMMDNIGALTFESGIQKYGYELKLQAAPVNPRAPSLDPKVRAIADQLWPARTDYSQANKRKEAA